MPYHSTKKKMDKVPKGFHKMPDGSIMKGATHGGKKAGNKAGNKQKKQTSRDMKAQTTKKTVGDCGCGCGGLKPVF